MSRLTPIHWRKLAKVFEKAGCGYVRTRGDHVIYWKKGALRPVVIPKYRQVPVFIIENNLKTAGISRKEYLKLLEGIYTPSLSKRKGIMPLRSDHIGTTKA